MKAWEVNGNWKHKESGKIYNLSYVIVAFDDDDPVKVISQKINMNAFTYLNGKVEYLDLPAVINM